MLIIFAEYVIMRQTSMKGALSFADVHYLFRMNLMSFSEQQRGNGELLL